MFAIVHTIVAHSQIEQYAAFTHIQRGCCGTGAHLCLLSGPGLSLFLEVARSAAAGILPFAMKAPSCPYAISVLMGTIVLERSGLKRFNHEAEQPTR
jgi:hypothetical protein